MSRAEIRAAERLVPDLADEMAELKTFWAGDRTADRARAQFGCMVGVLAALLGPEAVPPDGCWGYDRKTKRCRCQLHRALDDLRALTRRAPRRRRRTA